MKPRTPLIIAALIGIFLGLLSMNDAEASATYTATPLTAKLMATRTGGLTPILALPARHYDAGERVLVTARLAGTTNAVRMPRMALRADATGAATVRSTTVAINHPGRASGTQYVSLRWLFVAPVAGTYTLTARAEATSYVEPVSSTYLSVVAGSYLKTSTVDQRSTTWGPGIEECVGSRSHANPDVAACGTRDSSATVARKYVRIPSGVSRATFTADLELSREYGSYPGGDGKVRVKLYVTPQTKAGSTCRSTATASRDLSISSTRHHWHETKTVAGVNVSGCYRAYVRTVVTHLGGNPVGIHDRAQSNGIALLGG